MNIDIKNYGHYRVTSHGGRSFDLYNRTSGDVFTISKNDLEYILSSINPEHACHEVDGWYVGKRKKVGIDVA